MKLDELKEIAQSGNLLLHKYGFPATRVKYIYNSDEEYKKTKNWIKEMKTIHYTRNRHFARSKDMPDNQSYKINAKDYKELLLDGAKEE